MLGALFALSSDFTLGLANTVATFGGFITNINITNN